MITRVTAVLVLLTSCTFGSSEVRVIDHPGTDLKSILVSQVKLGEGSVLPIFHDSVVISLEEDGETKLIVPNRWILAVEAKAIAVASVSKDWLPMIRVEVSGHPTPPNVCGRVHRVYRYDREKKEFFLVKPAKAE